MFDFQPYLDFVRSHYAQSQGFYTPTDAILPLKVQSVVVPRQAPQPPSLGGHEELEDRSAERRVELFPVLEGLRRYALGEEREHVLLAGRPGSGKSMALRQLVVSLAEEVTGQAPQPPSLGGHEGGEGKIPVLVQLKGNVPILKAIADELENGDLELSESEVKRLLRHHKLILLLDGINEANDNLRRELEGFRQKYSTAPMIFTTRDLAIGGDLGIEKRFEMRPLSEQQLREFVGKYLPGSGDRLLLQLRDRLREIAETPLLLKMLCDLFRLTGEVPQNKGELFRGFDREYDKFKGMPAVSGEFRRFRSEVLQHLAYVMMVGDGGVDFELTIGRGVAEGAIEDLLRGRVDGPGAKAKEWLEDLVEHHLLQVAVDGRRLEFHHQLFQEYYAAEWLLGRVGGMDDERLDCEFLNFLKWTETVGLMVGLVEDEGMAVRVVERGLGVDLMLGARFAGGVRSVFQERTVGLVSETEVPDWLKVEMLGDTRSVCAIKRLRCLEDFDFGFAAGYALAKIKNLENDRSKTNFKYRSSARQIFLQDAGFREKYLPKIVNSSYGIEVITEIAEEEFLKFKNLFLDIGDQDSAISHRKLETLIIPLEGLPYQCVSHLLPEMKKLLLDEYGEVILPSFINIQANCKFYNYEIHQKAQTRHPPEKQQPPPGSTIYNINKVGNLNTGTVNIQGHQIGKSPPT